MNKQLKVKSYFTTCSLFLFLISVQLFAQNNQKPNVIVIYTDDHWFRVISHNDYSVHGIWTQPLLQDLVKRSLLSQEEYYKSLEKLLASNYYYIPIDQNFLINLLENTYLCLNCHENQ